MNSRFASPRTGRTPANTSKGRVSMIYTEWTLYGEFENGIFPTWDAYHAATFNPDIEIKVVRVIR